MKSNLPKHLLAKSQRRDKDPVTLQEHLFDTEKSASQIFRLDGRWGRNWCRFFQIRGGTAQQQFLLNLRIVSLFHDLGKANKDFYNAVSQPGFIAQTLRHEHISALLLHLPEIRSWLADNSRLDLEVITAAVLSHHLKAAETGDWKWGQPQTLAKSVPLYVHHPEVTAVLTRIAEVAELAGFPKLPSTPWSNSPLWRQAQETGIKTARQLRRYVRDSKDRQALLLAVKAGLIVADAAASGLVREGHPIESWIEDVVHSQAIAHNDIAEAILNPRANQIIQRTGKFKLHNFQEIAAQQGSRALLLAACGTGKTLVAWKWAETQSRKHEIGKVIFLYPKRGTATEGFRDYVGWAPEADAALLTGTAKYELEAMATNPSDAIKEKDFQADERLFALGFWSRRYFSATVDQFLSFLEHNYSSLCLLPVLADSAFIIDKVHSFDRRMFDALISFLKTFDLPVLCMTATLPPSRRDELVNAGLKVYPTSAERVELQDLGKKEGHPRYQLKPVANAEAAITKAVDAYLAGERVLWVVNTVNRCQSLAKRLTDILNIQVLTYHSRFRLQDRQVIHANTVDAFAFQVQRKAAIAITTQVCEMSLDLDADVLITELAPISSLIQRFGRANRHLVRGLEFQATLNVYHPPCSLPYAKEELDLADTFLKELGCSDISQWSLAEAMERYALSEPEADGSARFLEGGYFATPGAFRDTEDFAVPCILDCDFEAVKTLIELHKPYDGFKINVPEQWVNADPRPSWLPQYLGVASSDRYDLSLGFLTQEAGELG